MAFTLIKFASRSVFELCDEFGLDVNISLFGLENASVLMVSLRATVFGIGSVVGPGDDVSVVSNSFGVFTSTCKQFVVVVVFTQSKINGFSNRFWHVIQ